MQTLRRLFRAPGFALATILTLALGIGAITAIFSVVYAVLLEPMPFPKSGRLADLRGEVAGIFGLPGFAGGFRFTLALIDGLGALAPLLAAFGIYSAVAYTVTQRTGEFGIRIALGASPRHIARAVFQDGLRSPAFALPLGLGLTWAVGGLLRGMVFGVGVFHPPDGCRWNRLPPPDRDRRLLGACPPCAERRPRRRAAR